MKKNLLDKAVGNEIKARFKSLNVEDMPKWGAMSVTEMFHHCMMANTKILEGELKDHKPTLKELVFKNLFLYVLPAFPKNVKGPKMIDPKLVKIQPQDFDVKRIQLLETIELFANRATPIQATHPFFGRLNTKQWGIFSWMHMDHHLRQFGV